MCNEIMGVLGNDLINPLSLSRTQADRNYTPTTSKKARNKIFYCSIFLKSC
ncbi:unknown [Crocosphaera subtropica ATCC 51142]|uniref:Uncharacterized protein n=1 Tax=Crocosphaera subtropica (strain ATCC 51142 / BH68) TaxID=43989 RepID=B1WPV9_CROS5|nr:unknown [Crocosphaera subtropica ATCC 51142]